MELFMEYYPFKWKLEADLLKVKVRLFIFTIISVCAGLPALVWSVSDLIQHRKNGLCISVFIILLLSDIVEIFLSPYILLKQLLHEIRYFNWTFTVLWYLWMMSRVCGILLHQLVALERILSVKYPLYTAHVFSSPCFIIFYILVLICTYIGHIFLRYAYSVLIAFMVIVSVITWISLSCGASCSADHHSHASRKPDDHIVVVFIFTLLVFYLPYILLTFLSFLTEPFPNRRPPFHIPSFLLSMRLISDPLLCVLVCRQNLRIQTLLNPEGTSLVTSEMEI